jgi:hypothetical protein
MASPGHATRWPTRRSKRTSKKVEAAGPRGGHCLSARHGRAVGDGRASHRAQAAAAAGVDTGRSPAPRRGAASLRLVLACRLRPSCLGAYGLPSRLGRQYRCVRSGARRLCSAGGRRTNQADRAGLGSGWLAHQPTLRVPEHVHLLFLPPYSPELQPAEHLWPLTNTVLINRHFADLDELEDAQARRCVALLQRRDLIRSATRFHWWPLRIKKRQGPRTT